MVVRERFEQELQEVQGQFIALANSSILALQTAFEALVEQDLEKALKILEDDLVINRLEEEINDHVILMIAKQQPVATDLRRLMVLVKAAADMERVGDYAVNIAKEAIRIGKEPIVFPITNLQTMCNKTVEMLESIMKAFTEEDTVRAKEIAELDDYVDDLYGATITLLLRAGVENPAHISQITHLTFICRYLERSADHATNIAEHLFYLVKGKHYELNN
ncbi:MAG TPA: phosphate transport system regulatory protein PhoU [Lysinibacillus sp.]|jgi:phosphate transport system protein|uniref:Phosphate-specific transport system accessory protein PhoU n=1 Tax=Lysinibacillus fusiformis TaxID=28031 RepID=A0A2I0V139_9BACI|nr:MULTISPECIES: phosphate signaling complex protein PhoU [Lysinibacillus]HBT73112.1 phosphate transport system regulatory protein PhoU [Lysinibacillus sp.]KUF34047.1 PhoU family transcriptional regulator [Lysinibacillus sp. F5]MEE3805971.1 phosphate signaling complex protein PhoU [Lysinibacillus fusiformis]PKU51942.1 phosphate transport system regulatory protein PhoU [Lysinibacillus fusiformis]WCH46270.1 phosphate signaling complex protein PhoU [Lysinibacillus sp. OF-1]